VGSALRTLRKGEVVALFEAKPQMVTLLVGLGWQPRRGRDVDVDVSAFLLGNGGAVLSDQHFVFYNNPVSPDGSVRLLGDSRAGEELADDEVVEVRLLEVPPQVTRIRFAVSVYGATPTGRSVADLKSAYLRLLEQSTRDEIARYDIGERIDHPALVVAEMYRFAGRWKVKALSQGVKGGLAGLAGSLGVNV
jgi:tellurium resistance protein TerD